MIADVTCPILGADFLRHFNLLVDMKHARVLDGLTALTSQGKLSPYLVNSIKIANNFDVFHEVLQKYPELTQINSTVATKTAILHFIETNGPPSFTRPRRLNPQKLADAKAEFEYLMATGICQPSKSPWASPLHMAKKTNGSWRPCGDYRGVNAQTVPDRYPLPFILDCAAMLTNTSIYSKIELKRAYHQIPVNPEDIPKTAITTPFGLFEFKFMAFGLRNAAQTMQRLMNAITADLSFTFVYLDDILVASKNREEHVQHLDTLFRRLSENGLVINADKCEFGQPTLTFLGHLVTNAGFKPMPSKVEVIDKLKRPTIAKELKGFLASLNFYRRFLKNAIDDQRHLTALTHGNRKNDKTPLIWNTTAEEAFDNCKRKLAEAVLLAYPVVDAPLSVQVDASDYAVGAVLHQMVNEEVQPLGFYSKALSSAQLKYSAYDRELTAIYQAIIHFKDLLEGRHFTIFTDHKPITFAFRQRPEKASPRQVRQLELISQYSTDIRHIKGKENATADLLSRITAVTSTLVDLNALATDQQTDPELNTRLTAETALQQVPLLDGNLLWCDTSQKKPRPFVTTPFRQTVFNAIHGHSHGGTRATIRLMTERYYWPGIRKDTTTWVRACPQCQVTKVSRHVKAPLTSYPMVTQRFEHLNMDIIGPLPPSLGYRYCLTIIDRFTRWPEAIPLTNINADNIAKHLITRAGI